MEIDNTISGAKLNKIVPIVGAEGYTNIITKGDYTVKDLDVLLDALSKVQLSIRITEYSFW